MARGDAETGLRAYAARDRLELVAGDATARDRVIALWKQQRSQYGDDVLIVTRRNSDCAALNIVARDTLKAEGRIHGEEFSAPSIDRDDKATTIIVVGAFHEQEIGQRLQSLHEIERLSLGNAAL